MSTLLQVQEAITEAALLASGYDIRPLPQCRVQKNNNFRRSGDLKTNVAACLFLSHVSDQKKKRKENVLKMRDDEVVLIRENKEVDRTTDEDEVLMKNRGEKEMKKEEKQEERVMEVVTTSHLGLQTPRKYTDAQSLANTIVELIPEEAMNDLLAHAFVQSGPQDTCTIVLTTKEHMSNQLNAGKLHCVLCGHFFKGSRGLRTHQIIDHKIETECARQSALDSELQVVVYNPPSHLLCTSNASTAQFQMDTDDEFPDLGDRGLNLARKGDLESLKRLVLDGNWSAHSALDKHGNTCLTWAAGEGHLAVCQFLVDACGLDPLALTGARKRRRQALHWAARNGHIPVCRWLIRDCCADVDAGTDDGSTPLHLAIWNHQPATVRWLIEESGSNVNKKNTHGCNASQWAALNGDIKLLCYLKERGLDLTVINSNGRSAVHKAGLKGNLEACRWLLTPECEGGAGLSGSHVKEDNEGDTPANLAKSNGHSAVEKWLLHVQSTLSVNNS